jgi:MutS domain V
MLLPAADSQPHPASHYQRELATAGDSVAEALRQWHWIGWLRGAMFLSAVGLGLCAFLHVGGFFRGWWWAAGFALLVFLVIVFFHELLADRIRCGRLRMRLFEDGLARMDRRLSAVKVTPVACPAAIAGEARDLDLFGEHSLHKLLASVHTPEGIATLAGWMGQPAEVGVIRARQAAARALQPEQKWREEFELLVRQLAQARLARFGRVDTACGTSPLVQWCRARDWLAARGWILWLARLAAVVVVSGLVATVGFGVPVAWTGPPLLGALAVSFLLAVFFSGSVHDQFNQVSAGQGDIAVYRRLFAMIADCPAKGGRLDALRSELFSSGRDVRVETERLRWLAKAANLRGGLWFLPWIIAQFLTFFDVHVLALLERWKARHGHQVPGWFAALGEWEVLAALARLAWENPEWCWPEVAEPSAAGHQVLTAAGLGHPLIATDKVVANDMRLGPPGRFLLVTGSNMSGKSTLLRGIGLNIWLAQLGAPVFARQMSLPAVTVSTSMRVSDSLADGVSFFMAELKRLKQIVDVSTQASSDPARGHLFLLDEILQGTNSRERQIAVAAVVEALTDAGSLGAISTHDLELAAVPELAGRCETVHFREHFTETPAGKQMQFDYVMRPGISPTTNALKLLELVGLGPNVAFRSAKGPVPHSSSPKT